MKKIYLLMLMCLAALTAGAQEEKVLKVVMDSWYEYFLLDGDVPEGAKLSYQYPSDDEEEFSIIFEGTKNKMTISNLPKNVKVTGITANLRLSIYDGKSTTKAYLGEEEIGTLKVSGFMHDWGVDVTKDGVPCPYDMELYEGEHITNGNDLILTIESLNGTTTYRGYEVHYILVEDGGDTPADYDLAVLTFEDKDYKGGGNMMGENDWTSLIDSKQYGGLLLYGESGMGYDEDEEPYWWFDENNTGLYATLGERYGMYCYWGGGAAVSNYVTNTLDGASYLTQLSAYNPDGGKGGHEGSDNFIVCNGYDDQSAYGDDTRPVLTFADGEGKVIDHLYLALSAYTLNSLVNGDGFSSPAQAGDYVNIVFEGLDAEGNVLGTVTVPVLDAEGAPAMGYQKVELAELGAVVTLRLNMLSNLDNGYGLSVPAYYVLDDIAVRVPKQAGNPTLTIDALGYASAVFAQAVTVPEGLTACVVESVNEADAHVHLTAYAQAGETVKAGTPVIFRGAQGTYTLQPSEAEGTAPAQNLLQGNATENVDCEGLNAYVLAASAADATQPAFRPVAQTKGMYIPAGKAYLPMTSAASPAYRISLNEATGIQAAAIQTKGIYYNLQGQKVANPTKGQIYILNGKKVLY